jgi:hypothetical protein
MRALNRRVGLRSFAQTFGLEQRFPAATEKDHDDGNDVEQESQGEPREATQTFLDGHIGCDGTAYEACHDKEADIEHPWTVRGSVGSRRGDERCAGLDPFRKGLRIGHELFEASVAVHVVSASLPGDAVFTTLDGISIHRAAERFRQQSFVWRKPHRCLDGCRAKGDDCTDE